MYASLEGTATLFDRLRAGDSSARNELFARYLPRLRAWASGRLPQHARDLKETNDLVQEALAKAFIEVESFEMRHEGAFMAYLRTILRNKIIDEVRWVERRPKSVQADQMLSDSSESPLERVLGGEFMDQYELALEQLDEVVRQAVVLRLEFGYTYAAVRDAIGAPSTDAARMKIARGIHQLGKSIGGV